jgi:hypothetical protein
MCININEIGFIMHNNGILKKISTKTPKGSFLAPNIITQKCNNQSVSKNTSMDPIIIKNDNTINVEQIIIDKIDFQNFICNIFIFIRYNNNPHIIYENPIKNIKMNISDKRPLKSCIKNNIPKQDVAKI